MPFRDLLKKKERIDDAPSSHAQTYETAPVQASPEFKFIRTDTNTEETINPPSFADDPVPQPQIDARRPSPSPQRHSLGFSRKDSGDSASDRSGHKEHRRLSERLHLRSNKSRSPSAHSSNLPSDLPEIQDAYSDSGDKQEKEAQWEKRATMLAGKSPGSSANAGPPSGDMAQLNLNERKGRPRSISDAQSDVNIQEAIRLHEEGQLEQATAMFHQLAERGNVLSQVLYGLSLRHGWGCEKNEKQAFTYLSAAASNSADLESQALQAGMKKGGAAKGELVLAIFELANCYRYGWGVTIDKAAARQYYETAANLGDTDAMNEAAWCYLEGFGGKKDKFRAAQLLRLAEKSGAKTLGNTWIWKEKYDPK